MGFDSRQLTPLVVMRIVVLASEVRSFERAARAARDVAGLEVSAKTIERVMHDVGSELRQRRDASGRACEALARRPESPPELAVVECDGGRIRTRQPGQGPGVHLCGEGWREDKNACLTRAQRQVFCDDPQPDPPACFTDPEHVSKLLSGEGLSEESLGEVVPSGQAQESAQEWSSEAAEVSAEDWRPKPLVRTVLSSVCSAEQFGRQMAREARQRRFHEARGRVFVGDGLPWNWSIWKKHFGNYTPILDFIHVLPYLHAAAVAVHGGGRDAWEQYVVWMTGCWRGEVSQVIEELHGWQEKLGAAPRDGPEDDLRGVVETTARYLEKNRSRMNYPEYRRQGFPVTTAWMESVVKQINYRAKGSEMFWNDPAGAESILQVRAAALSEDDRLVRHLKTRPGCPYTRRPKAPIFPRHNRKS